MRIVSIKNVRPGMVLAKTILGSSQQNLLNANTVLNEKYINRITKLGITSVYIVDENIGQLEIDDVICEQTRLEAGKLTKDVMDKTKLGERYDPREVRKIINTIIDDLLSNRDMLVRLTDIRCHSDYVYFHSVNVAIMSGIVGIGLGYSQSKLQELMIGALFHDIGKTLLEDCTDIANTCVMDEPSEELQKHPQFGFDILKRNKSLSILSAHVALQHHERPDGEGYPRKISGSEIHEYAKIVSIANTYDLLTSDCPLKPRIPPHQAIEYLLFNSGTAFDTDLVNVFIQGIALYPEGTLVRLNTGETAVIIKSYRDFPTRPRVKILVSEPNKQIEGKEIELYKNPSFFILEVLENY